MHRGSKGVDPDLFAPSAGGYGANGGYSKGSSGRDPSAYASFADTGVDYGHSATNQTIPLATIELEHMSGFTGKGRNTLHAHPMDADGYIACMGAAVVIGNIRESHNQELLRGHDEEINVMSVSNSGGLLASAQIASRRRQEHGATIIVWELANRREIYRLPGFQRSVIQMAFSPDDHFLVASSEDCRVMLWDARTSELVLTKSFPTPITILNWGKSEEKARRPKYTLTMAYSSQLLTGELAYDIGCMQYRLEVAPFAMPNVGLARSYLCASMTPSKTDLLAGTIAGELVIFNTEAQTYRNALPVSRNGVHSVVACRATGFLYVGAGDGVLKKLVGREAEWNLVGQVQLVGGITSISVSPDGSQVFAGTSAGKMYHIVSTTLVPTELASSHLGSVAGCGYNEASSEEFATISMDGSLRVWNLSTYRLKCMATEAVAGLCLAFTKKQNPPLIVSGWADGWVRAFDASSAQKKWHIANAHRSEVTTVATSFNYVVSGSTDGAVNIWSTQTRELVLQFHEHKRAVTQVLVDIGKPHWVHSCGLDKSLFIYDLKNERRIMAQHSHDATFQGITQRLDSETEIITAGSDGRMLVWDCDIADPVQYLVDPNHLRVCAVNISPSGRYLAACGDDCEVKIYDLRTMSVVSAALGHSDTVNSVAWSPDERQLVSVGSDSCVCVWNFYTDEA
ncbi:hypothetical protein Poli38472_009480 [Pythium oligandrum]|uniref:Guanine nucleotide-binding protein subunit beta-like protein n=1 Tax=Pythium oligandrum TaxID=41045 RepID=A0A8K1CES6_PYTOL|nr:hypothetical protein Poli38472_009480 [Pythium oligandrum]|eukprot:TMW61987.1 hypothetical protein Poli38472_009480 [Pythium oligandrum]